MGQDITIQGRDGSFGGYLATPLSGEGPGIVVIQEIFGINDVMRQLADRLAHEGFVALAPDLFWRLEPGIQLSDRTDAEWKQALDLMGRFDIDKGVEDIQAAIMHLRGISSGKVCAVGYWLGGLLAYLTAARTDSDASVGYYGVNIPKYLDEADKIKKPLLLHIAAEDGFVPKEAQAKMLEGLNDNSNVTTYVYAGVDHAFARPGGKNFNAEAADLANSRTDQFFRKHLT